MPYSKIKVDPNALKEILEAFSSSVNILELQATCQLPDSPVQTLLNDYNGVLCELRGDKIAPCFCKAEVKVSKQGESYLVACTSDDCIVGNPTITLCPDERSAIQMWNTRKVKSVDSKGLTKEMFDKLVKKYEHEHQDDHEEEIGGACSAFDFILANHYT